MYVTDVPVSERLVAELEAEHGFDPSLGYTALEQIISLREQVSELEDLLEEPGECESCSGYSEAVRDAMQALERVQ